MQYYEVFQITVLINSNIPITHEIDTKIFIQSHQDYCLTLA